MIQLYSSFLFIWQIMPIKFVLLMSTDTPHYPHTKHQTASVLTLFSVFIRVLVQFEYFIEISRQRIRNIVFQINIKCFKKWKYHYSYHRKTVFLLYHFSYNNYFKSDYEILWIFFLGHNLGRY